MGERYQITRAIAKGAMAEVLEARLIAESGFERRVAVKRLLPEMAAQSSTRAAFIEEARIVGQLHHPNVISILDFGVIDGAPFQVLELVDGLDLGALLERAQEARLPMPVDVALHLAADIARGLAYVHRAQDAEGRPLGIVHRDVTPRNVLVSTSGEVKLADFGVAFATRRESQTRIGVYKGTPSYMAPEQGRGEAVDARADVFSLGCVLATILTGQSPLADARVRLEVYAGRAVPLDPLLPVELTTLLKAALECSRERRFQTADEMAEACWSAATARSSSDPVRRRREWLEAVQPRASERRAHPVGDLFAFEAVDSDPEDGLTRFTTVGTWQTPSEFTADGTTESERPSFTRTDEVTPLASPRAATLDPLIGTQLHGYRVIEAIGSGAQARIYRARHDILGLEVAIKVLAGDGEGSVKAARRLIREAQLLVRLRHPNLVSVLDCGTTPSGAPFVATELLSGRTLQQVLEAEAPLPASRVGSIVAQISRGLVAIHECHLVHRDLKPANIMITVEGGEERVRLLDFGIAVNVGDADEGTRLTSGDQFIGTPSYASPEQIRGPSQVTSASDLYSLGVLLYEMIAGHPPFRGDAVAVVQAHLSALPPPLDPREGSLGRLAMQLLEKDPARRPTGAAVLSELGEAPRRPNRMTTELPPMPPVTETKTYRRGAPWLGLSALLVVSALATFALSRGRDYPAPPPIVPLLVPSPALAPKAVAAEAAPAPLPAQEASSTEEVLALPKVDEVAPELARRTKRRPVDPTPLAEALARALASARMTEGDLADTTELAAFKAALENKDREGAKRAFRALGPVIKERAHSAPVLRRRLSSLSRRLKAISKGLPEAELERLEQRYFDLRGDLTREIESNGGALLSERIATLEEDIARSSPQPLP